MEIYYETESQSLKINFYYLHSHECAEHQWSPKIPFKKISS